MTNKYFLFFKSVLTDFNPINSTNDIINWLKERNKKVKVKIEKIKFSQMDQ